MSQLEPGRLNRPHHARIVLPLSLSIIFGSFTLGFYVAIQGPTMMDLNDLLHVNNDMMSHALALGSLAYSLGGLLSGVLFNYVDRQVLIPAYYVVFGVFNIITPYLSNFHIFTVMTVFKMMCAGGTDCGANVWILNMWPGKDAWLQALHFSFAVGCALGPLVVEPFLSTDEHREDSGSIDLTGAGGKVRIDSENGESRIYIPYAVSGSFCILAAALIVGLRILERRLRARELQAAQSPLQLTAGKRQSREQILLGAIQHPAAIEAGLGQLQLANQTQPAAGSAGHSHPLSVPETIPEEVPLNAAGLEGSPVAQTEASSSETPTGPQPTIEAKAQAPGAPQQQQPQSPSRHSSISSLAKQQDVSSSKPARPTTPTNQQQQQQQSNLALAASPDQLGICVPNHHQANHSRRLLSGSGSKSLQLADFDGANIKFTSKAREQEQGRPPYYVMLAIALSAMCLSFYCGIEITSMNYLATFAVNIDLQLPKSTAALMSSALTISFAVGRLFGIWIAAYMRPHRLFYLCAAIMALGNVFILIFANTTEMYLWYSICLFGIGCGPMYASIVSFYDDKISKVTNTVSGIFILGSMFNVALNTLIIGHRIIDNALILIVCNLIGAVLLLMLFGSLHMLTKVKKNNRKRKFEQQKVRLLQQRQEKELQLKQEQEQQVALLEANQSQNQHQPPQQIQAAQEGGQHTPTTHPNQQQQQHQQQQQQLTQETQAADQQTMTTTQKTPPRAADSSGNRAQESVAPTPPSDGAAVEQEQAK